MRARVAMVCLCLGACAPAERPPAPKKAEARPEAAVPAARSFHEFVPSLHGFQFRNGFAGSFFGTGESAYGLCGGMSFAAADYFLAGREIPRDLRPPAEGTPLYRYIYARQATSFGTLGAMGMKFVEWMQLPDEGAGPGEDSTHARTRAELPYVLRALEKGEPVVLGQVLVSTAGKGKAWDNHQVLAFDADTSDAARTVLRIYDSNFPLRNDVTISILREHGRVRITQHVPGRRDIPIRGFFRMAYSPVEPPRE